MKHTITLTLILCLLLSLCAICAGAEEQTTVTVTISNKGTLVATQVTVTVEDADGDGALTVNDALYIAHQNHYTGGADAGYGYYTGDYGLSMSKLWGDESGSFGYYLNNASCMSLADPVKDGDCITAFVYASTDWSDVFCYFDVSAKTVETGEEITLTLMAAGYDENWNPISYPVAGAKLIVDNALTGIVTDENGKASFKRNQAGAVVVSATSETMTLVPPVCTVTVNAAETQSETATEATTAGCNAIAGGTLVLVALIGCAMITRKEN